MLRSVIEDRLTASDGDCSVGSGRFSLTTVLGCSQLGVYADDVSGRQREVDKESVEDDGGAVAGKLLEELVNQSDLLVPMALRTSATLGLVDLVRKNVNTVRSLAEWLNADSYRMESLVAVLVDIGIFDRDDDRLSVTMKGDLLGSEHPARLRDLLDSDGCFGRSELALTHLKDSVVSGIPAYETVYGRGYWQDLRAQAHLAESLQSLRVQEPVFDEDLIVRSPEWNNVRSVVDVGGGDGGLLSRLLTEYPHLHGTVVDFPAFTAEAEKLFTDLGLSDRAKAVGASFFEYLPTGADVYLLSSIIYDWDEESAVRLLKRCAEAAGCSGAVLVCEISLDGWGEIPDSKAKLRMAATVPGGERNISQLIELGCAAGLTLVDQRGPSRYRSYLHFRPTS